MASYDELEDASRLPHAVYDDVIVVEHRKRPAGSSPATGDAPYVVLEFQNAERAIDRAAQFQVDGMSGVAPQVGKAYRVVVGPSNGAAGATGSGSLGVLRYETKR
jgi:hypothetical protein